MSEFLIQDTTLEDIADAIRAKKGTQAGIQVSNFPSEILSIPTGSSGAILNPKSNLMASPIGTPTDEIVRGHYFKYGDDYYSLGIQLNGSDSSGYVALFKKVNGVWVKQGNMTSFSGVHYQNVLNTLQYVFYVRENYNLHIVMFTFYEGSSSYIYLYDVDNLTLTHSYSTPGYNVVLFLYPNKNSLLGMYCATTDTIYRRDIKTDGSLGLQWSSVFTSVFGSTSTVPSMVSCTDGSTYIYVKRSDRPNVAKFYYNSSSYNSITMYSMGDYTPWSAMFYVPNVGVFFFKADGLSSATYGGIRPYGVYYKASFTDGSYPTCNIYNTDAYGTTFIPSNNNIFYDGTKQCMNGLGCGGYTDENNYNSQIILI